MQIEQRPKFTVKIFVHHQKLLKFLFFLYLFIPSLLYKIKMKYIKSFIYFSSLIYLFNEGINVKLIKNVEAQNNNKIKEKGLTNVVSQMISFNIFLHIYEYITHFTPFGT